MSIFFFILGWKRIALLALPVALFFGLIMGRMKPNRRIGFMKFIGWCAVIISFGYVVVTKTGAFEYITNYFGIDTMGRNDVYKYIEKYYQISLGFMGYGFATVPTIRRFKETAASFVDNHRTSIVFIEQIIYTRKAIKH